LISFDHLRAVAYQGAAQGVDVVYGASDVFRSPEGFQIGKVCIHLRRGFGARGVLENHPDAIDSHLLEVLGDDHARWDEPKVARSGVLADRLVDMAVRAARQQHAVLVEHAPGHSVSGVDVFGDCVIHEANRGNDLDLAALHIRLIDDATDAAEVVTVRMGVDHRNNRTFANLFIDEFQGRSGRFLGSQRVEDDPAGVPLDEANVSQVKTAHLVDLAGQDLIQAIGHIQHGLTLQRRMNAVVFFVGQKELVAAHVPGDVAGIGHDLLVWRSGDEAFLGFVEIPFVLEGQGLAQAILKFDGKRGGLFPFGIERFRRIARNNTSPARGESSIAEPDKKCDSKGQGQHFFYFHRKLLFCPKTIETCH